MAQEKNTPKQVQRFLKRLFSRGEVLEESFNKLCKAGCSADELAGLLFGICGVASGYPCKLADASGFSKAELDRLSASLKSAAELVARVNKTPLAPQNQLLGTLTGSAKRPPHAQAKMVAQLYGMLPGIMNTYAVHLEQYSVVMRQKLKRATLNHTTVVHILEYVKQCTGSPHYDDLANLLEQGFLVAGGAEKNVPRLFTADGLAKWNQRSTALGLNKVRSAESEFGN